MEKFKMDELMDKMADRIKIVTDSYHAIGSPITVEGHTIIPITSISVGIAGGGGSAGAKGKGKGESLAEGSIDTAGGGAGIRLKPLGFLVVSKDSVQLHALPVAPFRIPTLNASGILHGIADVIEKIKSPGAEKAQNKEEEKEK